MTPDYSRDVLRRAAPRPALVVLSYASAEHANLDDGGLHRVSLLHARAVSRTASWYLSLHCATLPRQVLATWDEYSSHSTSCAQNKRCLVPPCNSSPSGKATLKSRQPTPRTCLLQITCSYSILKWRGTMSKMSWSYHSSFRSPKRTSYQCLPVADPTPRWH